MAHFILIDSDSGYVWGDTTAETPMGACQIVDESIGEYGRTYEGVSQLGGRTGYLVYQAPAGFDIDSVGNGDGQNAELIEAVSQMPLIAKVRCFTVGEFA